MKKLIPAYVLSLLFSFMLWFYEPVVMYMLNVHDFWFDLHIIIKPIMEMFLGVFIVLSLLFTLIYYLNKKYAKTLTVYNICLVLFLALFIALYIQGNFLAGHLPSMDGTDINWNHYLDQNIISTVMWLSVFGITMFLGFKFKYETVINKIPFICFAIFVMLTSSMISSIRPHSWDRKHLNIATKENYSTVSTDKNFLVLLVDAVDAVMFEDVINSDDDYKKTLEDFTFFKDTTSTYLYTRDSVPYILTGMWNENKYDFDKYYNKAFDNSKLFKTLKENDYSINLYEDEMKWETDKALEIDNIEKLNRKINEFFYIKQQAKYDLFKYLPFPLKRYSRIETLAFNEAKVAGDFEFFTWSNPEAYKDYQVKEMAKTENKIFKFIHLEGGHVPFNMKKDVKYTKKATYYDKLEGTMTIIKTFLKQLKDNDAYDNSAIIIMSDHGYIAKGGPLGRQNPILFIKGFDEHHELEKSKLPISYSDLFSAYNDLIDDKKSDELFSDVSENRERRILKYDYLKEKHMEEYIQKGKAWNEKTLVPTGKKYDR